MSCGRAGEGLLGVAAHLHHVRELQEDRAGDGYRGGSGGGVGDGGEAGESGWKADELILAIVCQTALILGGFRSAIV